MKRENNIRGVVRERMNDSLFKISADELNFIVQPIGKFGLYHDQYLNY